MNEQKRNEIISRWRADASIRQIARDLGLARNTVISFFSSLYRNNFMMCRPRLTNESPNPTSAEDLSIPK